MNDGSNQLVIALTMKKAARQSSLGHTKAVVPPLLVGNIIIQKVTIQAGGTAMGALLLILHCLTLTILLKIDSTTGIKNTKAVDGIVMIGTVGLLAEKTDLKQLLKRSKKRKWPDWPKHGLLPI